MLYPINMKIKSKRKMQNIKEKLNGVKNGIKKYVKYLLFDRKKLSEIILIKLHI